MRPRPDRILKGYDQIAKQWERRARLKWRLREIFKGDGDDGNGSGDQHEIGEIADLLAEAHGITRQEALQWLLHTRDGKYFLAHIARKRAAIRGRTCQ
jgi:hypothetical protein